MNGFLVMNEWDEIDNNKYIDMDKPKVAGTAPLAVEMKAGRKYFWCSCGLSSTQPLCDGSHKGTDFTPVMTECEKDQTAWLCTCKQTNQPGFCDGSHKQI